MTTSALNKLGGNVSTLLNFVGSKGLTQTGGTNQTGGFESVMNKTQSSMTNGSSQDQAKAPVRSSDASGTYLLRINCLHPLSPLVISIYILSQIRHFLYKIISQ